MTEFRCRRGSACTARDMVKDARGMFTGAHQGALTFHGGLCAADRDRVAEALTWLPRDLRHLSAHLPRPVAGGSGRETGRIALSAPGSAPPWRQGVIDLMEDIHRYTGAWARMLSARVRVPLSCHGHWGTQVELACLLLLARLDDLLDLPEVEPGRDGVDGAVELLWLHERAVKVNGQQGARREPVHCPNCEQLELRREGDGAQCSLCRHRVSAQRLREMKTGGVLDSVGQ